MVFSVLEQQLADPTMQLKSDYDLFDDVGTTTAAQALIQAQHLIIAAAHHLQNLRHLQHDPALLAAQFQQQLL